MSLPWHPGHLNKGGQMEERARRTFLGLQKWLSEERMGQSGVAGCLQIKAAKHLG